jgi:hypothetical protein
MREFWVLGYGQRDFYLNITKFVEKRDESVKDIIDHIHHLLSGKVIYTLYFALSVLQLHG